MNLSIRNAEHRMIPYMPMVGGEESLAGPRHGSAAGRETNLGAMPAQGLVERMNGELNGFRERGLTRRDKSSIPFTLSSSKGRPDWETGRKIPRAAFIVESVVNGLRSFPGEVSFGQKWFTDLHFGSTWLTLSGQPQYDRSLPLGASSTTAGADLVVERWETNSRGDRVSPASQPTGPRCTYARRWPSRSDTVCLPPTPGP